jgi:hypothetical protein
MSPEEEVAAIKAAARERALFGGRISWGQRTDRRPFALTNSSAWSAGSSASDSPTEHSTRTPTRRQRPPDSRPVLEQEGNGSAPSLRRVAGEHKFKQEQPEKAEAASAAFLERVHPEGLEAVECERVHPEGLEAVDFFYMRPESLLDKFTSQRATFANIRVSARPVEVAAIVFDKSQSSRSSRCSTGAETSVLAANSVYNAVHAPSMIVRRFCALDLFSAMYLVRFSSLPCYVARRRIDTHALTARLG